jgi:hypothetical protein
MTDEEIKQSYYQYQSPTTNDASREFYLKAIKDSWIKKHYRNISKIEFMPKKQYHAIFMKLDK